jgi:hypothetical protein
MRERYDLLEREMNYEHCVANDKNQEQEYFKRKERVRAGQN